MLDNINVSACMCSGIALMSGGRDFSILCNGQKKNLFIEEVSITKGGDGHGSKRSSTCSAFA